MEFLKTANDVETYRRILKDILTEYARVPYSHGSIQQQVVVDRAGDHYMLMLVGHDGNRRVHGCLIHVDIIDGQLWIQRDGTEYGIARELLDAGVPKNKVILAIRAPEIVSAAELVPA